MPGSRAAGFVTQRAGQAHSCGSEETCLQEEGPVRSRGGRRQRRRRRRRRRRQPRGGRRRQPGWRLGCRLVRWYEIPSQSRCQGWTRPRPRPGKRQGPRQCRQRSWSLGQAKGFYKVVEARSASVKRGPADAGKAAGRKKSKGADQGPADAEAASRKKSKGADKPGETKSSETSAPKAKAKGKAKATEQADAEQEEKKKTSRKSCAYHRAKATAIKDGKTAEQAKEAAKKVASLKLPSAFVYGFIINYLARHACTLSAVMATYKTLKVRTSSLNSETLSPGLNPPQNPRKPQPFPLLLHLRLTTRRTSSITCGDMLLVDMSWLGFCSSLRLQGFDQLAKAPADLSIATRC